MWERRASPLGHMTNMATIAAMCWPLLPILPPLAIILALNMQPARAKYVLAYVHFPQRQLQPLLFVFPNSNTDCSLDSAAPKRDRLALLLSTHLTLCQGHLHCLCQTVPFFARGCNLTLWHLLGTQQTEFSSS